MAKWRGQIGFCVPRETDVDVWTEEIVERSYYGEVLRNTKTPYDTKQINEGFNVSNRISFIADPYAKENFYRMKYITFAGTKWEISNIEVEYYPRMVVNLGGLWNGS